MTHSEPTSIDASVSEEADVLGLCVAGTSSEALRNQVDRATEHHGDVLAPEQLTFIKDMVALLLDKPSASGAVGLADASNECRTLSAGSRALLREWPSPARGSGEPVPSVDHLQEAAGSF